LFKHYLPFGGLRNHTGSTVSNYKFTDQELDPESGLYNYVARLYDPVTGTFISADSIVPRAFDPQSLNRYAYARNNPLVYIDPTGHEDTESGNDVDDPDTSDSDTSGGDSENEGGFGGLGIGNPGSYGGGSTIDSPCFEGGYGGSGSEDNNASGGNTSTGEVGTGTKETQDPNSPGSVKTGQQTNTEVDKKAEDPNSKSFAEKALDFVDCTTDKAKGRYGSAVSISDTIGMWGAASLVSSIAVNTLTSIASSLSVAGKKNSMQAAAWGDKKSIAERFSIDRKAAKATSRMSGYRSFFGSVSKVSGIAGAVGTIASFGFRASVAGECSGCFK
jgi:RHS repeat-associated protein